tara:strand:+ start:220 stop:663 length:444 start_codon:yes stop_codon:yes gene_type:complete
MFGGSIGTTVLASMIPMVADLVMGSGPGAKAGQGDVGKELATTFLKSTGFLAPAKGEAVGSVFSMAPEARPRTAAELAAGSRQASQVQLSPQAQLVMNNQKLATKIPQFIQNSTNPQIADFRAKHVPMTVQQGRKTLATPQPKEIRV